MASQRKPTVEQITKTFKDIITRTSGKEISDVQFKFLNHIVITVIQIKTKSFMLIIDINNGLWDQLIDDGTITMMEMDSNDDKSLIDIVNTYNSISSTSWIELNSETLYNGGVIKIRPDDYEYDLALNKSLLPLKMRKSEFNNMQYALMKNSVSLIFTVKKKFEFEDLPDYGFSISRIFKVM